MTENYAEGVGERILNRERLGYLPQELSWEDGERTIYEFFMQEPLFLVQTSKQLSKLAGDFHVSREFFYEEQQMKTLSGGEKIKAQMMRLLLSEPTVLLLDEPSNDIDIATLEWLEDLILSWPHSVVYISHDETLIEKTANMVIHLEQLKRKSQSKFTVVRCTYEEYMKNRRDAYERQEMLALNERREKKIRDEKLRRIEQRVDHEQAIITRQDPHGAALLKKKMKAVKSLEHRYQRQDENMTDLPEQESAIFFKLGDKNAAVPAGKNVLDYSLDHLYTPDSSRLLAADIHLRLRGSEKICIVGRNGAGKTTLLRKIAAELLGRSDIRAEYMPQNYEDLLYLHMTPVDFLDDSGDKETRTKIRTFLGALKYTVDEMDHSVAELSGGQKAKILLLRMSMSEANVLILDEPTRNFSPLSGPVIRRMLADFPGAIISISHDRKYMEEVCDKVYELTREGLKLKEE